MHIALNEVANDLKLKSLVQLGLTESPSTSADA